jgi:polyphosphate kinase 2
MKIIMIQKYNNFINESKMSHSELEESKEKLMKELEMYKYFIASKISWKDNQVFYKDFENIDIDLILKDLIKKLGEEVVSIFNVETFLRKIHQILDLKQKSTKRNIRDEFIEYYISLDKRIETISGEDKPSAYDEYYDNREGERSILPRTQYEKEKFDLQVELLKMQEWGKEKGKKIAILFEGRDTAGKGSSIKRFTEYLNPKGFRIVSLGVPTEEEKNNWFDRYEKYLPNPGEIVFFDRSWYNRAVVEPAMGYCTEKQYKDFMENVIGWEEDLIKKGIILIKFWFSITKEKQQKRFELRQKSPLKYWKFSPNDAKVVDKWDLITYYKNQMFNHTSTDRSPWVVINSNDKRVARLNAMRYVLSVVDYDDKNDEVTNFYPEVVNVLK